ncbi:MAG: zinc-ribbon domain-containing protein [Candidatus Bathyarchaeia archaeon]
MRRVALVFLFLCSSFFPFQLQAGASETVKAPNNLECVCGHKQVSVLLFDFGDVKHDPSSTPEKYRQIISEMNASLYRQSYNKFWLLGGEVYNWQNSEYVLGVAANFILAKNVLEHSHGLTNLMPDGYLIGVYAGDVSPFAFPSMGVAVVGENWGLATYMHEFGHLIGLPDIYNPQSIAEWDVMGLAGKERPLERDEFSAWSRIQLGWLTSDDVVITKTAPRTLLEVESINELGGTRAVMVPVATPAPESWWQAQTAQYYVIIEARSTTLVIYYFTGYEAVEVGWDVYNFTRLAMIQMLSEEPRRVFTSESTPINADIGIVLLYTQGHSLGIKLTSNADAKNAEEALKAIGLASNAFRGILLKSNGLNEAWESFQSGDFDAARSSAEKAKAEAPVLLALQATILVLVVACPIVAILLYNRRKKSVRTTMKPTPTEALGSKFCRQCGAEIPRKSKFCQACGAKLS